MAKTNKSFFTSFVCFPCLRCGKKSVSISHFMIYSKLFSFFDKSEPLEFTDLLCDCCDARHFLAINHGDIVYDRDTRRYPSEYYDDNNSAVVKFHLIKNSEYLPDNNFDNFGHIAVSPRKTRFSPDELHIIFKQSNGRCHLCGKNWKLSEHSRKGWHVDHMIPNTGGGLDTEIMENFRVACAGCNLKKGRGYTKKDIYFAINQLMKAIDDLSTGVLKSLKITRDTNKIQHY